MYVCIYIIIYIYVCTYVCMYIYIYIYVCPQENRLFQTPFEGNLMFVFRRVCILEAP